jgi:hypothetical protein
LVTKSKVSMSVQPHVATGDIPNLLEGCAHSLPEQDGPEQEEVNWFQ